MSIPPAAGGLVLIVKVGTRTCAILVEHILETMRPLSVERIAAAPNFVRGVSIIRGSATPVIDLEMLLDGGTNAQSKGRFVTVELGERRMALAVDAVLGIRNLQPAALQELPPLLGGGVETTLIDAIGTEDTQLLLLLRTARLVPDEVWATLARGMEER